MTAPAGPWHAAIGNAFIGRFETRELAQAEIDGSKLLATGIGWVVNIQTRERWMRNPETNGWRPFVPVAKPRAQQGAPSSRPLRPHRADIDD